MTIGQMRNSMRALSNEEREIVVRPENPRRDAEPSLSRPLFGEQIPTLRAMNPQRFSDRLKNDSAIFRLLPEQTYNHAQAAWRECPA
jgi:hypothetical protein